MLKFFLASPCLAASINKFNMSSIYCINTTFFHQTFLTDAITKTFHYIIPNCIGTTDMTPLKFLKLI